MDVDAMHEYRSQARYVRFEMEFVHLEVTDGASNLVSLNVPSTHFKSYLKLLS